MNISHINSTLNLDAGPLMLAADVLLLVILVVNLIVGIPLHIYIIFLLTRAGGLDESVFFAVSQSVSEIIYALSAPLYVLSVVRLCLASLLNFFTGFGMIARVMFHSLVCVEWYMAVVHPVTFLKFKPLKYRLLCLIVAWIFAPTCCIILLFASEFASLDFFGSFYLIIVIMEFYWCVSILKVLKQPAPGKREDSGMSNSKKKAFRIVLINLQTHLIQLLPLIVSYPLKFFFPSYIMTGAISITIAINIAAGLVPPFFILHRHLKTL